MHVISEAEACSWLGRRVSLIAREGEPLASGRLQHVSSRSVFLLQENRAAEPFGGTVRLIPLATIERIVPAGSEDVTT
jgi:hypothetical protein